MSSARGDSSGQTIPVKADRRIVTILFADISGFTSMSERFDAEIVTVIMNGCFDLMSAVIRKHGGTIDKYIGDCVMALFGAPEAIADGPKRSLDAALEMRESIDSRSRELDLPVTLALHLGVNTGEVVYGPVGSREEGRTTAMGDAVNIASRLKDASASGQILIGPETWRRTREYFEFDRLGSLAIKGKETKVAAWSLRSKKADPCRRGAALGREGPLAGRRRELGLLEAWARRTLDGEGSIVHLIGEAGIGKTRLVAELTRRLEGCGLRVLVGKAVSTGTSRGYHLFGDLLRGWCGAADLASPSESMQMLETLVTELETGEAAEALPLLQLLAGTGLSQAARERLATIEAESLRAMIAYRLRNLLTAAARQCPLILVFEDLHWADQSSIELTEAILRIVETAPIMLLTVAQPGFLDSSERIHRASAERHSDRRRELRLGALSEEESDGLLAGFFGNRELPAPLKAQVRALAGGNPFFIEELAQSLLEGETSGSGEVSNGKPMGSGPIAIPASINELVMSRFDRLDECSKELLRLSAVLGDVFSRTVLERLASRHLDLDGGMARLEDMNLIRPARRGGDLEYVFAHDIVRETVYSSILNTRRKEIHGLAARALEELHADRLPEVYSLLAYHYGQAENEEKAEEYLRLAGETSLKRAASTEAVVCLSRALGIYLRNKAERMDRERVAGLYHGIAKAYASKGDYREAIRNFDLALSYLGVRPSRPGVRSAIDAIAGSAGLLAALYLPAFLPKRVPSAKESLRIALESERTQMLTMSRSGEQILAALSLARRILALDSSRLPESRWHILHGSQLCSSLGLFRLAHRMAGYALKTGRGDDNRQAVGLHNCILVYSVLSGARPFPYDRATRSEAISGGDFHSYTYDFLFFAGMHEICSGNLEFAAALLGEASSLAAEFDHPQMRGISSSLQLSLDLGLSNFTAVIENERVFRRTIWLRTADDYEAVEGRAKAAEALLSLGEIEKAASILDRDRIVLRKAWPVMPLFRANFDIASMHLAILRLEEPSDAVDGRRRSARLRECRQCAERAISTARKCSYIRVDAYRLAGSMHWLAGRARRAFHWWGRSVDEGARLGYRLQLSKAYFEIGKRLGSAPAGSGGMRGIDAEGWLAMAETLFHELGLERDLEALAELRSAREIRGGTRPEASDAFA